jgi:hypothetical protein
MSDARANQRIVRITASGGDSVDVAASSQRRTSGPSARKTQISVASIVPDEPVMLMAEAR